MRDLSCSICPNCVRKCLRIELIQPVGLNYVVSNFLKQFWMMNTSSGIRPHCIGKVLWLEPIQAIRLNNVFGHFLKQSRMMNTTSGIHPNCIRKCLGLLSNTKASSAAARDDTCESEGRRHMNDYDALQLRSISV